MKSIEWVYKYVKYEVKVIYILTGAYFLIFILINMNFLESSSIFYLLDKLNLTINWIFNSNKDLFCNKKNASLYVRRRLNQS